MFETLVGIVILAAAIWAIINIAQSGATTGKKFLWILLVVLFPLIGFIIWYLVGPKPASASI